MAIEIHRPAVERCRAGVIRSALVAAVVVAALATLRGLSQLAVELWRTPSQPSAVVQWAATVAACGAATGYALALLRDVHRLARTRVHRPLDTLPPATTWRARTAATLLGLTIWPAVNATGAAASPAPAAAAVATASVTRGPAVVQVPDPGWVPTAPDHPLAEIALVTPTPNAPDVKHIIVHRGDCLWDIVERHLGPGATGLDVARAWPRWYAANRQVIGPNPDLLLPGQALVVPVGAAR